MVVPHVTDDEGGLLRVPSDLPLDNGRLSARRRFGAGTEVKLQSVGGGSGAGHEGSGQQDDEAWEGRFHGAMPFLWPERGEKASGNFRQQFSLWPFACLRRPLCRGTLSSCFEK